MSRCVDPGMRPVCVSDYRNVQPWWMVVNVGGGLRRSFLYERSSPDVTVFVLFQHIMPKKSSCSFFLETDRHQHETAIEWNEWSLSVFIATGSLSKIAVVHEIIVFWSRSNRAMVHRRKITFFLTDKFIIRILIPSFGQSIGCPQWRQSLKLCVKILLA